MSPATPNFTISKARLVGLFLECIAYGISLITIPLCIRALVWYRGRMKSLGSIHWITLIAALLLAFFATFDIIITLIWLINAFVVYEGPGGPSAVFMDISNWINVMKGVDLIFPILIGDLILIYRCWIVYNKSYIVTIAPLVIWLADAAMGSYILYIESHLHGEATLREDRLTPAFTAFFVMTVAQNLITTSLIVIRIRKVDKMTSQYIATITNTGFITSSCWRTQLQRVMRIVTESGLIYTTTAVITLATYLPGANAFYSVTDAELPIIVIAFNLIVIRCKSQASEDTEYTYPYPESSGIRFDNHRSTIRSMALSSPNVDDLESGNKVRVTSKGGSQSSNDD